MSKTLVFTTILILPNVRTDVSHIRPWLASRVLNFNLFYLIATSYCPFKNVIFVLEWFQNSIFQIRKTTNSFSTHDCMGKSMAKLYAP